MWSYIVDVFHRASLNKALSTHERALLKALQGALLGILVDAVPQLLQIASGTAHFSLTGMSVSALIGAIALGSLKLWLAQNDPVVGSLLDAYAQQKEQTALAAVIQPGAASDLSVPALHFVVPAQRVLVTKSALPVTLPSLPPVALAPATPSIADQATAPVPVVSPMQFQNPTSGPNAAPTMSMPAIPLPPA